jgi:hypothetical protein
LQSQSSHIEQGQKKGNENLGEEERNGRRRKERVAINIGPN